jgi:hypothetical protein
MPLEVQLTVNTPPSLFSISQGAESLNLSPPPSCRRPACWAKPPPRCICQGSISHGDLSPERLENSRQPFLLNPCHSDTKCRWHPDNTTNLQVHRRTHISEIGDGLPWPFTFYVQLHLAFVNG